MPLLPHLSPHPSYEAERRKLQAELPRVPLASQISLAEAFHRKHAGDVFANYLMAVLHAQTDAKFNAIPFAQTAVQLSKFAPEQVALLFDIYLEFHFQEQIAALIGHVEAAGRTSAELELQIAAYYEAIGNLERAITHFRASERLFTSASDKDSVRWRLYVALRKANHTAEAQTMLATFANDDSYRTNILVELAQIEKGQAANAVLQDIEKALADDSSVSDDEKERLHLAAGRLQEKQKDYDSAFLSWQRSRALVKELYNGREFETMLRDTKAFYNADLFQRTLPYANLSSEPVFVIGMPRSGTTLVAQILSAHPEAVSAGELVRLRREAESFRQTYQVPRGLRKLQADIEAGELAGRSKDYLDLAHLIAGRSAKHFVDKTPEEFWSVGYIHMLFPNAKFLNLIRHPGDVFISTYQNAFPRNFSYAFDQKAFAHYYVQRDKMIAHWKKLVPERILDVHYEQLVQSPEAEIRRILSFIGLDWDPACMKFFELPSLIHTFSRDQVRSAINTRSVGRWQKYQTHLGPLFDALGTLGYSHSEIAA